MAAVELAYLAAALIAELAPSQLGVDSLAAGLTVEAVQAGVIIEVLLDTQIQIQGALLEHHADLLQHLCGCTSHAVAVKTDIALLDLQ